MTAGDPNSEAYHIIAELLVTIRRIVHRGLQRASGETWYLDGCPDGMFERLVNRKENEVAIDRFNPDYQELITFASLDDLAEIIEYNGDLQLLLAGLEQEGVPMVERLRNIEALRLKLAATLPFDDADYETLNRYRRDFRESLTRRKNAPGEQTPIPSPPEESAVDESSEVEELSEVAVDASEGPFVGSEFSTQAATFDELVQVVGGSPRPADEDELTEVAETSDEGFKTVVASVEQQAISAAVDAAVEPSAIAAERAMAEDDDVAVLRVLHREVMAIAERAFRSDFDHERPVWDALRSSGWYDIKKADLALAPVELFYSVAEEVRSMDSDGAAAHEVKAHLDAKGFSKLLLSLREMFLRHDP